MRRICVNVEIRQKALELRFSELMLCCVFYVRFFMRYQRQLGKGLLFREKNRIRRVFASTAQFAHETRSERARGLLAVFLSKVAAITEFGEKAHNFISKTKELIQKLRQAKDRETNRLYALKKLLEREHFALLAFYESE